MDGPEFWQNHFLAESWGKRRRRRSRRGICRFAVRLGRLLPGEFLRPLYSAADSWRQPACDGLVVFRDPLQVRKGGTRFDAEFHEAVRGGEAAPKVPVAGPKSDRHQHFLRRGGELPAKDEISE